MISFFGKSINRQFLSSMIFFFFLVFIGIHVIFYTQHAIKDAYQEEITGLTHKADSFRKMERNFSQMVYRVKNYMAYKKETDFIEVNERAIELQKNIATLKELALSPREKELLFKMESFKERYLVDFIPTLTSNQPTNLRMINEDMLNEINELFYFSREASSGGIQNLLQVQEEYDEAMDKLRLYAYLFMGLVFILLIYIVRVISRKIGEPLHQLSIASQELASGKDVTFPIYDRQDEIGILSSSFSDMASTISEREMEMQAQNEELMAQQDELTEKQNELQVSLNELSHLNTALNYSSVVSITDQNGRILSVNDQFCSISKYTKEELIGSRHHILNSGFHPDRYFSKLWATINKGEIWTGEFKNKAKDGTLYWVQSTIVPYVDVVSNTPYQFISISRDITNLKVAEAQLKRSLGEAQKTKSMLENLNELNTVMSTNLDKKELLKDVLDKLSTIIYFEKGLFYLKDAKDSYASIGVSENQINQFLKNEEESIFIRLSETMKPHIVKREPYPNEKGIDSNNFVSYDLYVPVFNGKQKCIAVLIVTRLGSTFLEEEINEIMGLLKRVSIALERIFLYEETENNRQLNQDIIDNVAEAIQFVGLDGGLMQFNDQMCTLIGKNYHHQTNFTSYHIWLTDLIDRVINKEDLRLFIKNAIFEEIKGSQSIRYEIEEPEKYVIEVYAEPIFHGEMKIGTLFVHRDITSEHEIDVMKSELVSTVSHELRTPLASVLGYAELILTRELKPEKQQKYIQTIYKEANRLTNLINDFLDLQRMESGKQSYRFETVNLASLCEEVMDVFMMNGKGHSFSFENNTIYSTIKGDKEKLIQLFTNLMSNAIKFSPNGGKIIVSLTQNEDEIFIHVSDEGLGIPEDEIPKIFQKFHRIDNSDRRKIGGTGLGLAICKEIVEAHSGKISVHSELSKGTIFTTSFPLVKVGSIEKQLQSLKSGNQLPNVMVLEDDISLASLLVEELRDTGFFVTHFKSGEEAIESLQGLIPDLVVVDIMLEGEVNGWDFIKHLKQKEESSKIPIFISSALDEKEKAQLMGASDYLTKPYPPSKLSTVILQSLLHHQYNGHILIPQNNTKGNEED